MALSCSSATFSLKRSNTCSRPCERSSSFWNPASDERNSLHLRSPMKFSLGLSSQSLHSCKQLSHAQIASPLCEAGLSSLPEDGKNSSGRHLNSERHRQSSLVSGTSRFPFSTSHTKPLIASLLASAVSSSSSSSKYPASFSLNSTSISKLSVCAQPNSPPDRSSISHKSGNLHGASAYTQQRSNVIQQGNNVRARESTRCKSVATSGVLRLSEAEESGLLSFLSSERAKVVAMVALAMALCNADRVVMSVAIVPLAAAHGWTGSFSGVVQSSFLWGYLLSPIAGGMLADRYGGKRVLGWGVAIWSFATLATPWAARRSLGALLAMRVLMGLAEGVAMPCMNNMICKWFPRSERSRAVGMTMAGFHMGSVAGLVLTPPLMLTRFGLEGPFATFGLMGFAWLSVWLVAIARDPQSQSRISRDEYLYIQQGSDSLTTGSVRRSSKRSQRGRMPPFGLLLSKLPTWAIIVANSMNNWGYFILLSWMPVYFTTVLGVNLKEAAWFSAVPWAMMAGVGFVAGACSDFLVEAGVTITTVRKIMQSIGFVGPAIALLGLNAVRNPTVAAAWLTAAVGLSAFSQAGFLVNHQEIGPRYAGVLHGMSNTAGTLAAIVSTMGIGFFIERLGSFQSFLTLTSILYIASTIFWGLTASGERIF